MGKKRHRRRYANNKPLSDSPTSCQIASLSSDGRGVGKVEDKSVFVSGALPGETVEFLYTAKRRDYDEGILHKVISASADRVEPQCQYFGACGGCVLQHYSVDKQIAFKLDQLKNNLTRIGKVDVSEYVAPITGKIWGYRHKARLGCRHVHKKGKVLVGFRERQSSFIMEMDRCEVLHPSVGSRIDGLAKLIAQLSVYDKIAQIEVAVADNGCGLVFRNLEAFTEDDIEALIQFAKDNELVIYQQPGGLDSIELIYPDHYIPTYTAAAFDIRFEFAPTDFTQVNPSVNTQMLELAIEWLALSKDDRVLDLYCGIGNFSLPIARYSGFVLGVEGAAVMTEKARHNANLNGIDNVAFETHNLADDADKFSWLDKHASFNKILLDPPRSGAKEIIGKLGRSGAQAILYVSCHPATLARDADRLVNEFAYKLKKATILNMFPHTAHVESIALFVK